MPSLKEVPLPVARRLPLYLRVLRRAAASGEAWASSEAMAERLGLTAIQVRKDLAALGAQGTPKRGFAVEGTLALVEALLGADDLADVFVVGSGELAAAVLSDEGLARRGFRVVALFDPDPAKAGRKLGGLAILPLSKLPDLVGRMGVRLAILAMSGSGLAEAADALAASGLAGVLDLSGAGIDLPPSVAVLRADYGSRLSTLAGALVRA